jgi:hypothetical protein
MLISQSLSYGWWYHISIGTSYEKKAVSCHLYSIAADAEVHHEAYPNFAEPLGFNGDNVIFLGYNCIYYSESSACGKYQE